MQKFRAWNIKEKFFYEWEQMKENNDLCFFFNNPKEIILLTYTPFKDSTKKDVCEGDIVDMETTFWWQTKSGKVRKGCERYAEEFKKAHGEHCYCVVERDKRTGNFTGFGLAFVDSGKIIGNIYQNPELLEKGS